ncbi:MAG: S8/S53 family peptidase [Nocardiopsaceae bacterium]|nr:S8/S53 family peptidase [Nocardiopsaceae bacterium]
MRESYRPLRAGAGAALGLATAALAGTIAVGAASAGPAAASTPTAGPAAGGTAGFTAITGSAGPAAGEITGTYTAKRMSVEVTLAPRHAAELNRELRALYTKGSGRYHKFLARGQFDQRYAPGARDARAVGDYLRRRGLAVSRTTSPFLIRAAGSSSQVAHAFRTTLSVYRDSRGNGYFANSRPVYVPTSMWSAVLGVVGLDDTVRPHPLSSHPLESSPPPNRPAANPTAARGHAIGSRCEAGYVTRKEMFAYVNKGTSFPHGYGGGPDCSGLTPAQTNSIYGAPKPRPKTRGAGVRAAIFELSAYRPSDSITWARHFYGARYKPHVHAIRIDGGALHPHCPADDTCPAHDDGYAGDIEATADIEQEMAIAPDARLQVYDAPNDRTGQTSLDEYTAIAKADSAQTVSTSWGECERDDGEAYAKAENTIFEQMAAQGQSVFAAAGDNGALDCVGNDGSTAAAVDDPAAQPWVTSVGGTSLETFNPGTSRHPHYPRAGTETAWNVDNLCSRKGRKPGNDNLGGPYWCGAGAYETGAGGGGSSEFWGAPPWQHGPGTGRYARHGSSSCALAASASTPCRQVPDVSADADEYTPYAEYCTGGSGTANSVCAQPGYDGWFGIGGTSLAAPLWAALITDRDGYHGRRSGDIGPLAYGWLRHHPGRYFHDIARPGKSRRRGVVMARNNGIFPTTSGYDEATGIGTPKFATIITG